MDLDGNNLLTRDEVREALTKLDVNGEVPSEEDLTYVIRMADRDKTGTIDRGEMNVLGAVRIFVAARQRALGGGRGGRRGVLRIRICKSCSRVIELPQRTDVLCSAIGPHAEQSSRLKSLCATPGMEGATE